MGVSWEKGLHGAGRWGGEKSTFFVQEVEVSGKYLSLGDGALGKFQWRMLQV